MTKTTTTAYWVTTSIIAFVLASGGAADLVRQTDTTAGMLHLGYPLYFLTILGIWKLLGAAVLVAPGLPRLKEWAYAGAIFDFTGAVASHLAMSDAARHIATPAVFAAITLASWALRPGRRRLTGAATARASGGGPHSCKPAAEVEFEDREPGFACFVDRPAQ